MGITRQEKRKREAQMLKEASLKYSGLARQFVRLAIKKTLREARRDRRKK